MEQQKSPKIKFDIARAVQIALMIGILIFIAIQSGDNPFVVLIYIIIVPIFLTVLYVTRPTHTATTRHDTRVTYRPVSAEYVAKLRKRRLTKGIITLVIGLFICFSIFFPYENLDFSPLAFVLDFLFSDGSIVMFFFLMGAGPSMVLLGSRWTYQGWKGFDLPNNRPTTPLNLKKPLIIGGSILVVMILAAVIIVAVAERNTQPIGERPTNQELEAMTNRDNERKRSVQFIARMVDAYGLEHPEWPWDDADLTSYLREYEREDRFIFVIVRGDRQILQMQQVPAAIDTIGVMPGYTCDDEFLLPTEERVVAIITQLERDNKYHCVNTVPPAATDATTP